MKDYLADALLAADAADSLTLRIGTVTGTSPLEVNVGGQAGLTASRLSSYSSPGTADLVAVIQTKTDLLILGKIISGG